MTDIEFRCRLSFRNYVYIGGLANMRFNGLLAASVTLITICTTSCGSGPALTAISSPPPNYTANAKFAYVSTALGAIDEFSISPSGEWTKIGTVFGQTGNTGLWIAIDPKHRFVYAIGGSSAPNPSTISMFKITTGSGLLVPTSPATISIPGSFSQNIAVDGLGQFVYTADTDSNTVSSLTINQATGVLTPTTVPSIMAGNETNGVTTDALGKYVYASSDYSGLIYSFIIDPATGNLTPNSPSSVAGASGAYAGTINAADTFYYSPGHAGNSITVLGISPSTGALSTIASGNITAGQGPTSVGLTSDGKYAYSTNRDADTISEFAVNATTGLMTSFGNPVAPGADQPIQMVVDPSNQLAYVACEGDLVAIFGIGADGALTKLSTIATDGAALQIVLVPR